MKSAIALTLAFVVAMGLAASPAVAAGLDSGSSSAKQDPGYVEAKKQIGAGNYAAAVPLLEQVVAADPKNADAYNYLGFSLRQSGNRDAALVNYQKALAIDPAHRGANEYLGELYLEMGKPDMAKERLKVLDKACFFGCDEYRELKEAINAYAAKAGG
ncbi:MAG TPA: tetratricopeptide repeat protein [Kiloniellales bacterium]